MNKKILPTTIVVIMACVSWLIWTVDRPMTTLTWDLYQHQTIWQSLLTGNVSWLTTKLSDTFQFAMYTPLFALKLGVWSLLLSNFISVPASWWLLELLFFVVTVITSVIFATVWTKDRWVWCISGVMSALTFESLLAQSGFALVPQTLSALLGIWGLYFFMKSSRIWVLVLLVLAVLIHFVIGAFLLLLALSAYLMLTYSTTWRRLRRSIKFGVMLFFVVSLTLMLIQRLGPLDPFQTSESRLFTLTLWQKITTINTWYAGLGIIGLVGMWISWLRGTSRLSMLVLLSLMQLFLIGLPIPYTMKLYVVTRYFGQVLMGIGFVFLFRQFSNPVLKYSLAGLTLGLIVFNFYFSQLTFKKAFDSFDGPTSISSEEMDAAHFLSERYNTQGANVLMISDPATMHVLEGLSGVNTPGGVFVRASNRSRIDDLFPSRSPDAIRTDLWQIQDGITGKPDRYILVVSGRFMAWQRLPDQLRRDSNFSIWGPRQLSEEGARFSQELSVDSSFNRVFQNNSVQIFEVTNRE